VHDDLRETGASHAIVHHGVYGHAAADLMDQWLIAQGASPVPSSGDDWLFALPPS
jgi:hypothetical protein